MAYSVPELLLVGAAQNLVLNGSTDSKLACPGDPPEDQDGSDSYDFELAW